MVRARSSPARKCILLVDDDADLRGLVADLLAEETGRPVRTAANGSLAWQLLEDGLVPEVIVLDLHHADGAEDGWDFRARQRASAAHASIPVVIFSARGRTVEALPMVRKSEPVENLVRAVRKLLPPGEA